jgi:dTDP-4-dehydrorhamnose 3,5-epimerase-like enzyme
MSLVKIIDIRSVVDDKTGYLGFVEQNKDIPFEIKRIYFIKKVPQGVDRGFHAHKTLHQVAVCLSGRVNMIFDNGNETEEVVLDSATKGVIIFPGLWRTMTEFSKDALLVVFASDFYDESDYIRDYNEFLKYILKTRN